MEPRKCNYCGIEFVPNVKGRKYCSDKCREIVHWKRQNEKRRIVTSCKKKTKEPSALSIINAEARAMGMTYGQYEGWRRWKACHS